MVSVKLMLMNNIIVKNSRIQVPRNAEWILNLVFDITGKCQVSRLVYVSKDIKDRFDILNTKIPYESFEEYDLYSEYSDKVKLMEDRVTVTRHVYYIVSGKELANWDKDRLNSIIATLNSNGIHFIVVDTDPDSIVASIRHSSSIIDMGNYPGAISVDCVV